MAKALEQLKAIALDTLREKHPTFPEHALPKPKYTDKTANGLEKCIVDYINFIGGMAERRNNTGRYIFPKSYTNVFGKEHVLQKGKFIKGTGTNGTSDVSGIYKGTPLAIEVKVGKDKMSKDQERYKRDFECAGGIYIIAKSFDQFYNEFNTVF